LKTIYTRLLDLSLVLGIKRPKKKELKLNFKGKKITKEGRQSWMPDQIENKRLKMQNGTQVLREI